ncbi:MAG: regulatory protein GemA [Halioglobus sp.]
MSISNKDRRTIFALSRELQLDNEERKALQRQVTGKDSTTTMTPLEAAAMIAHLQKRRGPVKNYPKRAGRVPTNLDREPMLKKIEALLASMALSWQYAEGIAWRITGGKGDRPDSQPGVRRMEWVRSERDLRAVIAALHVEQKKRQKNLQGSEIK